MNKNTDEAINRNEQPQSKVHEASAVAAMLVENDPKYDPWLAIRKWGEMRAGVESSAKGG